MCEWKPDFEQLKEQTEENSRQIAGLAQTNAVQNEQIKTLFETTEKQSEDLSGRQARQLPPRFAESAGVHTRALRKGRRGWYVR